MHNHLSFHLFTLDSANAQNQLKVTQISLTDQTRMGKNLRAVGAFSPVPEIGTRARLEMHKDETRTVLFEGICAARPVPLGNGLQEVCFANEPSSPPLASSTEPLDISQSALQGSLRWFAPELLDGLHLIVQAEWLQHCSGEMDLFSAISAQFPHGKISSLNSNLHPFAPARQTGYEVLECKLKSISAPQTGGLNIYPSQTEPLNIGGKLTPLPRYWFDGVWRVAWAYRQKRIDRAHFWIPRRRGSKARQGATELVLKIAHIDSIKEFDPSAATFLDKPAAAGVIQAAIAAAQSELRTRNRWRLQVDIAPECGPAVPGRPIRLMHKEQLWTGIIEWEKWEISASGIRHQVSSHLALKGSEADAPVSTRLAPCPADGLLGIPQRMADLLTEITVENDAVSQFESLAANPPASTAELKGRLSSIPTTVTLRLQSLKSHRCLTRDLYPREGGEELKARAANSSALSEAEGEMMEFCNHEPGMDSLAKNGGQGPQGGTSPHFDQPNI